MKKLIVYLLLIFSMFFNFNVYAKQNSKEENVNNSILKITGSLGNCKEDIYVTFDKYKTITGTAKEGTTIKITNSVLINKEYVITQEYEFIVGASGVFSKDIYLDLGDNNIEIYAYIKEQCDNKKYSIKRLSKDVKEEMEYNIIIPSDRINSKIK